MYQQEKVLKNILLQNMHERIDWDKGSKKKEGCHYCFSTSKQKESAYWFPLDPEEILLKM